MNRRRFLFLSMAPIAGAMSCKLFARPMDDDIPLNGRWPGGDSYNAQTSPCGVVVTLSGSALYITGVACVSIHHRYWLYLSRYFCRRRCL